MHFKIYGKLDILLIWFLLIFVVISVSSLRCRPSRRTAVLGFLWIFFLFDFKAPAVSSYHKICPHRELQALWVCSLFPFTSNRTAGPTFLALWLLKGRWYSEQRLLSVHMSWDLKGVVLIDETCDFHLLSFHCWVATCDRRLAEVWKNFGGS